MFGYLIHSFEQNGCTRTKAEVSTYPFTTSWKALVSALNSPLFTVPQQWKHSSMLHPVLYAGRVSLTQTEQLSDFVLQGRGDGMELRAPSLILFNLNVSKHFPATRRLRYFLLFVWIH
ncbi:hypothetical protein CEXT_810961 [Caerostris extrusa]|uniref:Uncharacterized protein n=1 Tax=Caerostris extrusa TaxID=172846 RepID=A0AAV4P9P5_CAEEX|nr:hypothetical protein CEXT_810961 [Caerostris extrusa]